MNPAVPVEMIFVLAIIFASLSLVFLNGKGASLFVGHNTILEPAFSPGKLCKALGVCLCIVTVFLLITALIWNSCPEWFIYIFRAVIGGSILACAVICNLNILVRKR